jgi:hypothetical protein
MDGKIVVLLMAGFFGGLLILATNLYSLWQDGVEVTKDLAKSLLSTSLKYTNAIVVIVVYARHDEWIGGRTPLTFVILFFAATIALEAWFDIGKTTKTLRDDAIKQRASRSQ